MPSSTFENKYRIYYEDTDAQGIVYYANYLKFYERARTDFLRNLDINQSKLTEEREILFVVRRCEIDYKSSAKLDDLISVETTIEKINNASMEMHQKITRSSDGLLLNEAKCYLVCVNKDIKPTRVPDDLRQILLR